MIRRRMERENTSTNLLPEIAKGKVSNSSQSASQFLEDSGLELRGGVSSLLSRPSTAGSSARGGGWSAKSPPPSSGRFTPSPPPGAKGPARSRPLLNTTGSRKVGPVGMQADQHAMLESCRVWIMCGSQRVSWRELRRLSLLLGKCLHLIISTSALNSKHYN